MAEEEEWSSGIAAAGAHEQEEEDEWRRYDRSGAELDVKSVKAARMREIETLRQNKVYDTVPRRVAWSSARWPDAS